MVRFAVGLSLMFLVLQGAHAVGPLGGMVLDYLKQLAAEEVKSRVTDAIKSRVTDAMMPAPTGGMPKAGMVNVPPEYRDMMMKEPAKNPPPPTRDEATRLVRDATAVGMLEPGQAEQMMQMFTSDSMPPAARGMVFAMVKRQVAAFADLGKQMTALPPADRQAYAADMAKQIGAMPKEQQDKVLHKLESGETVFPRDMAEQVRTSLRAAAR